jgi:hypothetical protein
VLDERSTEPRHFVPIRGRRAAIAVAFLIGTALASSTLTASANQTAGPTYIGTTGVYFPGWSADNCRVSEMLNYGTSRAIIGSWVASGGGCGGTPANMGAGWLGARAVGWRDGYWCGDTGWSYSTVAISYWAVAGNLCVNPSGVQCFQTDGHIRAYGQYLNGSWGYIYLGTGPARTHCDNF